MILTHHPLRLVLLVVFAVPSALLCTVTIVSAVLRTMRLPVCPNCLWGSARPSQRVGFVDHARSAICLFPFRCEHCLKRFYAFDRARKELKHMRHRKARPHPHTYVKARPHAHT